MPHERHTQKNPEPDAMADSHGEDEATPGTGKNLTAPLVRVVIMTDNTSLAPGGINYAINTNAFRSDVSRELASSFLAHGVIHMTTQTVVMPSSSDWGTPPKWVERTRKAAASWERDGEDTTAEVKR